MKKATLAAALAAIVFLALHYLSLVSAAAPPLRTLGPASGIQIGAAVSASALRNDATYRETLRREFGMMTPENAMKFGPLSPSQGQYNFTDADQIVNFAQSNGMLVRGHTLVWHVDNPTWLTSGNFTRDQAIAILRNHIQTVVSRYRGRVFAWDVVNEAILADGTYRNSFWLQKIGPQYIEMAFRWAHEADPQALLFYNDFSNHGLNTRSEAIYRMVRDLRSRGVPIHGVGFQLHLRVDQPPAPQPIAANMQRLAQLGVQVHFTEMDISIQYAPGTVEERLAAQAQLYSNMMSLCMNASNCSAFVTWGVSDQYSNIVRRSTAFDAPLLFDRNFQPKPAYFALVDLLNPQLPPDPTGPAMRVDVLPASVGGQTQVQFRLFNVTDVYGLEARCLVNPSALTGTAYTNGDGFNSSNSFFVDRGYNAADGSWVVAATRLQPNPAISGSMLAFGLNYTVQDTRNGEVNCSLVAVNSDGRPLSLEVINGTTAPAALAAQTLSEQPLVLAEQPAALAAINGAVSYQNAPDNAGITVQLLANDGVLDEVLTMPDGTFHFTEVPAGTYTLQARAPYHLPVTVPVTVPADGQVVQLASAMLPGGDTDNSGGIDILDATIIGANFGVQTPPAPANADLNRDALVNISDLVLVGANFGFSGPVTVTP